MTPPKSKAAMAQPTAPPGDVEDVTAGDSNAEAEAINYLGQILEAVQSTAEEISGLQVRLTNQESELDGLKDIVNGLVQSAGPLIQAYNDYRNPSKPVGEGATPSAGNAQGAPALSGLLSNPDLLAVLAQQLLAPRGPDPLNALQYAAQMARMMREIMGESNGKEQFDAFYKGVQIGQRGKLPPFGDDMTTGNPSQHSPRHHAVAGEDDHIIEMP